MTFDEVMDEMADAGERSILLGNGFSQSWDQQIFNYANLLEQADFGNREDVIRALFDNLITYDFERVMQSLVSARTVLRSYGDYQQTVDQIEADEEVLKDALIAAIASTHPDLPRQVAEEQFIAVRHFLSRFNNIFSVNYDLLLYWARNQGDLEPKGYETDDGFRKDQSWVGHGTNQQVHFLHGGLHIYDGEYAIRKHAYEEGLPIIEQVRGNLERGMFPLFVSEPTAELKQRRIAKHPYLSFCYQALSEMSGSLVIFGHSIDENEKHIFDQIKRSRVDRVFVSIFGDENSEPSVRVKANARAYLEEKGRTVSFFAAESTVVWA
ncbi:MAG: DUF4917 family protein [Pseudomonadales bacterium]